jgi:hypothetical protein
LAKKRRQKTEKKDEYDFKLPEFDEHEYIALELRKSKLAFIAFFFAILVVVITFLFYTVTYPDWRGPIVLGLLAVVALPFIINLLKLDTTDFDWKNWFGAGAIYILSWLAIFILVCNPPFSDFADPEIDDEFSYIKSGSDPNNWSQLDLEDSLPLISPVKIKVRAKITDNNEIDDDSVKLTIRPSIFNNATQSTFQMTHISGNIYETLLVPENTTQGFKFGRFTFIIEAKDVQGHSSVIERTFDIGIGSV